MHHNHHDHKSELPLILFTLCISASVGVVLVDLVFSACETVASGGFAPASATYSLRGGPSASGFMLQTSLAHLVLGLAALLLTTIGMLASVAHLAKPLRAPRALTNLASSWLSREILVVAAFWGCIVLWILAQFVSALAGFVLGLASLTVGCFLLAAAAKAYAIPSQPAWHGADTTIELFAAACGAGIPLACAIALWCQAYTPMPLGMDLSAGQDTGEATNQAVGVAASMALAASSALADSTTCCPYLATKALLAMAILGPTAAHLLYSFAHKVRLARMSFIENPTPREELARKQLTKLEGPRRAILGLIDASILIAAAASLIWAFFGNVSPLLASIPGIFGCIAFFLARARFYQMAVTNRHAVRRNFR